VRQATAQLAGFINIGKRILLAWSKDCATNAITPWLAGLFRKHAQA
jgi:hypothetical protein